jgi:energy-coupling factor transporter ATP-binding protein EcfA2
MKIIAIIGDTHSGKSALIRNLTGIYRGERIFQLAFTDGVKSVFIKNAALQERSQITPEQLLDQLTDLQNNRHIDLAIIPFRIEGTVASLNGIPHNFPSGEVYIQTLVDNGLDVDIIIKLSEFRFANEALNSICKNMMITPWNIRTKLVRELLYLL